MLPLAHLCIKAGLGVAEIHLALKLACIEAAAEKAKIANRLNHSRISAITGLTRKEVRSLEPLLARQDLPQTAARAKHRAARVLQGWREDPEFLSARGAPMHLKVRGSGTTFYTLARRYGGDVTPLSILQELQRLGAVSKSARSMVKIRRATLQERSLSTDAVTEFARLMRDFGFSALEHVQASSDSTYVGFREVQEISDDEAALFATTFAERAASFIDSVDRWKASQGRIRSSPAGQLPKEARVGLGVYLVKYPKPGDPPAPAKKRR